MEERVKLAKRRLQAQNESMVAQKQMLIDTTMQASVYLYESRMAEGLADSGFGLAVPPITVIENLHNIVKAECLQEFQNKLWFSDENASNSLEVKLLESFRGLLAVANVDAAKDMEACADLCKIDIENCLTGLEEHLRKLTSDSPKYIGILRGKMNKWLDETVKDATKTTLVRAENLQSLLERVAPPTTTAFSTEKNSDKELRLKTLVVDATKKFIELTDASRRKSGSTETKASYIRNHVKSQLEADIRAVFGANEPTSPHVTELESQMNEHIVSKMSRAIDEIDKKLDGFCTPLLVKTRSLAVPTSSMAPPPTFESRLKKSLPDEEILIKKEVIDGDTIVPAFIKKEVIARRAEPVPEAAPENRLLAPAPLEASDKDAPPLVFQFAVSSIQMGVLNRTNFTPVILNNEFGERYTYTKVGLTTKGLLVYSSQIGDSSRQGTLLETFDVANYFIQSLDVPRATKILGICGKLRSITVEVMLGFLFRKLKISAEQNVNQNCTKAVIVVPFWLASAQRIQLKDAARIAGFSESYLMSDVSSCAFTLATNLEDKGCTQKRNIAIISETADYVDCVVYTVAGGYPNIKIKMTGHCGQYLVKSRQNQSNKNYMKDAVMIMCKDALAQPESKFETRRMPTPSTKPVAILTTCSEGPFQAFWKNVLNSVRTELNGNTCRLLLNENEAIIKGAIMLSKNVQDIGEVVQDKLNCQVWRCLMLKHGQAGPTVISPAPLNNGDVLLPVPGKKTKVEFCFPRWKTEVTFYQSGITLADTQVHPRRLTQIPVGFLQMFDKYPKRQSGLYKQFIPNLRVDHEGIVCLDFVLVVTRKRIRNNYNSQAASTTQFSGVKRKRGVLSDMRTSTQELEKGQCVDYQRLSINDPRISWAAPNLTEKQIVNFNKLLMDLDTYKE